MGTSVMTPSNTELMMSVHKLTQDFFERFPKSEWSYNIGVYGNVFCLDKSTWSPSFKVRIVADQKYKKIADFVVLCHLVHAGAKDSEGVQSIGPRMGLDSYNPPNLDLVSWRCEQIT